MTSFCLDEIIKEGTEIRKYVTGNPGAIYQVVFGHMDKITEAYKKNMAFLPVSAMSTYRNKSLLK